MPLEATVPAHGLLDRGPVEVHPRLSISDRCEFTYAGRCNRHARTASSSREARPPARSHAREPQCGSSVRVQVIGQPYDAQQAVCPCLPCAEPLPLRFAQCAAWLPHAVIRGHSTGSRSPHDAVQAVSRCLMHRATCQPCCMVAPSHRRPCMRLLWAAVLPSAVVAAKHWLQLAHRSCCCCRIAEALATGIWDDTAFANCEWCPRGKTR